MKNINLSSFQLGLVQLLLKFLTSTINNNIHIRNIGLTGKTIYLIRRASCVSVIKLQIFLCTVNPLCHHTMTEETHARMGEGKHK